MASRLLLACALAGAATGLRFRPLTEKEQADLKDFQNESQVFWTYVNEDWTKEFVQPAKDAIEPTKQRVGRFLRHAKDLKEKAMNLNSALENATGLGAKENLKKVNGSAVLAMLKEHAKRKLNASTGEEALSNFFSEASKRIAAGNAKDAQLGQVQPAKTQPKRSLIDILQINTEDPAWQMAAKGVKGMKKAANWVNEAKQGGDVAQKFEELLESIPKDKVNQVKDVVLPLLVGNTAIKDIPMTSTERAVVNFGLLAGVLRKEKHTPEEAHQHYEEGRKAIADYLGKTDGKNASAGA